MRQKTGGVRQVDAFDSQEGRMNRQAHTFRLSLLAAMVLILLSLSTKAQSTNLALEGTEFPSATDGVDIFSGKLEQVLPLIKASGRGGMTQALFLPLRNTPWRVLETASSINGDKIYRFYKADQTNYANNFARGGYSTLGQLQVETKFTGAFLWETPSVTELRFTSNSGKVVHFRDVLTNGQPYESQSRGCVVSGFHPNPEPACSRGRIFRSIDGSNATFVADADIYDRIFEDFSGPSTFQLQGNISGTLYLNNGSKMRIEGNVNNVTNIVTRITDRNGNYLKFDYITEPDYTLGFLRKITDSLNREITIVYGDTTQSSYFDEIVYKGFGSAERRIRINYTKIENAMLSGQSLGVALFFGVQTRCNFISSGEPCDASPVGGGPGGHLATSLVVPSSVVLANGRQYQFYYNNYLELARIKYPTGSYTDYTYAGVIGADAEGYTPPALSGSGGEIYRRISSLKNFAETGQLVGEKLFSNIPQFVAGSHPSFPILDNVTIDVKDSNGTGVSSSRHYYYDIPQSGTMYTFLPMNFGKEHKTEILDAVSQAVLRTTEITWKQRAPFPWCGISTWTVYICDTVSDPDSGPPMDPRVTEVKTTLENGQVSKKTFAYDPYNNVTDASEFDFGSGTPGPLLRHIHTNYQTASNYINAHLLNLPIQVSVYDSSDSEKGRTTYEYDNYSTDANHAGLTPRPSISGFDFAFDTAYLTRGNLTATTNHLFTNGSITGSISSYSQYDVAGNVIKTIDARGSMTTFYFTDHFGGADGDAHSNSSPTELSSQAQVSYAFTTRATDPLGHSFYKKYDYHTGRIVTLEDANGLISNTYSENDPLDRPTKIIVAVNTALQAQVSMSYDDIGRTITTTSDQNTNTDGALVSKEVFDSFGRGIETRQYEGGLNCIVRQQEYDALGRACRTSNPYRPLQGETALWTQTAFDGLGRVFSVITPDGARVEMAYSGNRTLVTEQTGRRRMSMTNAAGQLKDVWEITGPDSETESVSFPGHPEITAAYHTSYAYDVFDDLITVTQGSQPTRSFVYDSIKRLLSETKPESGRTDYQYDELGNILVKTDARGVSTHLSYDAASRPVRRWYNASNLISATSQNNPALPSSVGVSDEVKFFYDSQELPNGSPAYSRGHSTGRPVAVTYGSGSSEGDYFAFDVAGQVTLKIQQTGGINYQVQSSYNLTGAVTSQTYPSGHTVSYNYDQAGRLGDKDSLNLAFTGNLGDGVARTYSAGILYSPFGGMTKEQLGTDIAIFNKRFYNSRGQLAEIRESTSYTGPADATFNRGAIINFYSSCWGMCGGSNSTAQMTDNNGRIKKQQVFVPLTDQLENTPSVTWTQQYDYDSLNRLQRIHEYTGNPALDWQQEYIYDRYGNRRIHQTNTWGGGINKTDFTVNAVNNRLGVPSGQIGTMAYDNAGNLTTDTYSGFGVTRQFDAENRMSSETQANGFLAASYSYNAGGMRVRRTVGGVETWQVHGIDGELLAEYSANSPAGSPQTEYGYRNGQALIVAGTSTLSAPAPSGLVAAPSGNGTSMMLTWSAASGAANYRVERKSAAGNFILAGTSTSTSFTDPGVTLGTAYLYKVCAADAAANCTSSYGNQALGTAASFTDPTITTISEDPTGVTATPIRAIHITQLRSTVNAVRSLAGLPNATWSNPTITAGVSMINAVDVSELRQKLDEALTALVIQTSAYTDPTLAGAPNGSAVKRSHIAELRQRATTGSGGTAVGPTIPFINWLVTDHLGTPRIIFDKSGSLANVKRHDYLPFGEEVLIGVRTVALGYAAANGLRQRFISQERDNETGLDYFGARFYAGTQGRFISVDPANAGAYLADPQSWNGYSYALNNPLSYIDPSGLDVIWVTDGLGHYGAFESEAAYLEYLEKDPNLTWVPVPTGTNIGILGDDLWGPTDFILANNQLIGKEVTLGSDGNFHLAHPEDSSLYCQELVLELGVKRGPALVTSMEYMWMFMSLFTVPVPSGGPLTSLGLGATETAATKTATLTGPALARQLGREGEAAVRKQAEIGIKTAVKINGATRVPDGLTSTVLSEVKNAKYVSYTKQLREYAGFAQDTGRRFDLYVRPGAKLSGPLKEAGDSGLINILKIEF